MMRTMKLAALVWALLFCVVSVNGLMAAPSVDHAQHHGEHHAGTHSTGICAWLCAAGQDVESVSVQPNPQFQPIEQAAVAPVDTLLPLASFYSRFRGPPVSFS